MSSTAALAPVRHVAVVTQAMLASTSAAGALGTWSAWNRYQVATGEWGVGVAAWVSADNTAASAAVVWLMACVATVVTFLTWSWRARWNAERLSDLPHRLRRGWVVGCWVVPVFPLIVFEDVWRTSRPGQPAVEHVRDLPRARLVHYWWYTATACALTGLWLATALSREPTLDAVLNVASLTTVAAVLQIVAAALAITMVRQITKWQSAHSPQWTTKLR
jgi:uncharacterized protein DUF4328